MLTRRPSVTIERHRAGVLSRVNIARGSFQHVALATIAQLAEIRCVKVETLRLVPIAIKRYCTRLLRAESLEPDFLKTVSLTATTQLATLGSVEVVQSSQVTVTK